MIGISGSSGKMGNFAFLLLKDYDNVVKFDKMAKNDENCFDNLELFLQNDIEVLVDFSNSELSKTLLIECINKGIKVITGTSNIPNICEIAKLAKEKKVSFVYLENFSKGINDLVNVLDKFNCDQVELIEEHNVTKQDISQTAITLGDILHIKQKEISSVRTIKKQSNHYIKFYYQNEEIEIIHKCHNTNAYKEILLKEYKKIISDDFYYKCGIIDNMSK